MPRTKTPTFDKIKDLVMTLPPGELDRVIDMCELLQEFNEAMAGKEEQK